MIIYFLLKKKINIIKSDIIKIIILIIKKIIFILILF